MTLNRARALALLTTFALASLPANAQEPGPLVDKILAAAGGKEKLLKIFRMQEVFHFGETPDPPAGKSRTKRTSIIELPQSWWLGGKERGEEPAKDDVRAWSLDLLVDPKSQIELLPDFTDDGRPCTGLQISGSVNPAMKLWFDKETLLLRRLDWRSDFYRFSDWREHDGLKYASRTIIFKLKSGKAWFYHEITGVERLAELPPEIAKP